MYTVVPLNSFISESLSFWFVFSINDSPSRITAKYIFCDNGKIFDKFFFSHKMFLNGYALLALPFLSRSQNSKSNYFGKTPRIVRNIFITSFFFFVRFLWGFYSITKKVCHWSTDFETWRSYSIIYSNLDLLILVKLITNSSILFICWRWKSNNFVIFISSFSMPSFCELFVSF